MERERERKGIQCELLSVFLYESTRTYLYYMPTVKDEPVVCDVPSKGGLRFL